MGLFQTLFRANSSFSESRAQYQEMDHERQKRLERYKLSWEAYLAELPDPLVVDGAADDNVKINPARAIINTGVYFLFGSELKFQMSPDADVRFSSGSTTASEAPVNYSAKADRKPTEEDPTPDPRPEKVPGEKAGFKKPNLHSDVNPNPKWLIQLNKAWKANRKKSLLYNMGLTGAIHGDVFVKIEPEAAGINYEFPRLVILDPANVDVHTDPEDVDKVVKFCIEYTVEVKNEVTGEVEPVLRVQEIEAVLDEETRRPTDWTITDFEQPMSFAPDTGYVPMEGERRQVGEPKNWGYAWPPIEHCQNIEMPHVYWGLPDLDESSVEVIKSIQRSMSSLNKIVRIHASPRMFAKNVMPDQVDEIDVSADNIITLPNIDAELSVLQTLQNMAPAIEYADKQREMLLEMIQTPPIALGQFETASTAISGVTLSILYAPILQKTDLKRISYGDMIERLNHKMLVLMGFSEEDFESLILVWGENMPGSAYLERQTLEQDMNMGVSSYTLHERLGYDPELEQKRKTAETEQSLALQKQYAPEPTFGQGPPGAKGETRGGNNNPAGKGNKSGSMGGTKAAGTPKSPPGQKK